MPLLILPIFAIGFLFFLALVAVYAAKKLFTTTHLTILSDTKKRDVVRYSNKTDM